jgi:orotate phosphoribosyltransferase
VSNTDALGALLVEHALLEGDFVLRSGRRSTYYLDKYRFETQPELLRQLGERLARRPARRTGTRGRRTGRFGVHGVRSALHHRAR